MEVLRVRGDDLTTSFTREAAKLKRPAAQYKALLNYWRLVVHRDDVRWPDASPSIEDGLRSDLRAVQTHRESFLGDPRSHYLPPLLFHEMVTASWLRACGAEETARLLIMDLVELVIYAGCEPGCERLRFGRDLSLPMMLLAPGFVCGGELSPFPIGPRAVERLEVLVDKDGFSREALGAADVDLESLYVNFCKQMKATHNAGWPVLLAAPPALHPDGRLDIQQGEGVKQIWKDFDQWARLQARALGERRP
jgi:hypothetical protein